ncbi:hypothetical protein [Methylocella sp.]|uniref:hypothetical protein n=1 Tax=Methylocella sp. TaxID=1978226 RepID=UPI0037832B33
MPAFTFEILTQDGVAVETETLPGAKAAWCYAEFLASMLREKAGARIVVRDEAGGIVIQTAAATAVASIGWCCDFACPLKEKPGDR